MNRRKWAWYFVRQWHSKH